MGFCWEVPLCIGRSHCDCALTQAISQGASLLHFSASLIYSARCYCHGSMCRRGPCAALRSLSCDHFFVSRCASMGVPHFVVYCGAPLHKNTGLSCIRPYFMGVPHLAVTGAPLHKNADLSDHSYVFDGRLHCLLVCVDCGEPLHKNACLFHHSTVEDSGP